MGLRISYQKKRACQTTITLGLFLVTGCMSFYQPTPTKTKGLYYEKIKEWQLRIKDEGWSEGLVTDVVRNLTKLAKYRKDEYDSWDTPKEFIGRGFEGDCEDIAIFVMGTLKRLEYPYLVRVLAVSTSDQDHALLRVRLPEGDWKIYDTMSFPLKEIDRLFYRPIVEFDENDIIYFEKKRT